MVGLDLIFGFDVYSEDFDDYSCSLLSLICDLFNGDFFVGIGNGVFFELDYMNEDGIDYIFIINVLFKQVIVQVNGEVKFLLVSIIELFGGFGEVFVINNQL